MVLNLHSQNVTHGSYSFLFFICFLEKNKTKNGRISPTFGLEERSLLRFLSFFSTSLSSFKPEDSSTRRRGSSSNRGLIFFLLLLFFPIFTERNQTFSWRSCTHQIFYVLARPFHSYIVLFLFLFFFSSGWQNKHALWCLRYT